MLSKFLCLAALEIWPRRLLAQTLAKHNESLLSKSIGYQPEYHTVIISASGSPVVSCLAKIFAKQNVPLNSFMIIFLPCRTGFTTGLGHRKKMIGINLTINSKPARLRENAGLLAVAEV